MVDLSNRMDLGFVWMGSETCPTFMQNYGKVPNTTALKKKDV